MVKYINTKVYTKHFEAILDILVKNKTLAYPIRHYFTQPFFKDTARIEVDKALTKKPLQELWNYISSQPDTQDYLEGIETYGGNLQSDSMDFSWLYKLVNNIILADLFLLELDIYLYHFKLENITKGYLPVYYTLS